MTRPAALDFAAAAVIWSLAGEAFAQGFQGGLRGAVSDSGGVVPGVEITLTNEQTGIARSTVTNERGEYAFGNIDPGTYAVTAALAGYKTIDRGGIRIATQTFLVLDLTLEVGAIEEHVTVTDNAPLIETANASTGTVLDAAALETLPSAGRAAFLVGTTVPTVIASGDAQFTRQQDQGNASLLSLGGGTRRGNNYTLDGVPITDLTNRAVANPTIEALVDVKVQVHTYDAEMGRTGGGVFNTTLRSGTNNFHGTAFFQTRPVWGAANNYFAQKALEQCPPGDASCVARNTKPDTAWQTAGAGFGGPIVKNRTFFWFAAEDYRDVSTRNSPGIVLPTLAERRGDFSATTSGGAPIRIYDPLTHLAFPDNIIPPARLNPVAVRMLSYLPPPHRNVDDGAANFNTQAVIDDKFQQMYSVKVEHKFSGTVRLTGFYLYNRTDEPCSNFIAGLDDPNRFIDQNDGLVKRRPQIVAINHTWIPGDRSAVALRFGWTRFPDNPSLSIDYDPAQLGFSQRFLGLVRQTGVPKFPSVRFTSGYQGLGAQSPVKEQVYRSWSANGSYSRLVGTHTYKLGAEYRRIGALLDSPSCPSGCFAFGREFTSSSGLNDGGALDGNAMATFLLGYPSGDSQSSASTMGLTTPLDIYARYYGGYVQDDWRLGSRLTLNIGLRIEHEDGIREENDGITVGFDPAKASALTSIVIPASIDPTGGTPARRVTGGLLYAGVDGAPTHQGRPPAANWSPRAGAVYAIDARTVLRGGYGLFWAPWNYPPPNPTNYGAVGYSNNTSVPQTIGVPTVSLSDPFPNGLVAPSGSSLGALAGVGTSINFVDPQRTAPRVQQYSVDLRREVGAGFAVTVAYIGARGDHLPLGGTSDVSINLNQLDPKYLPLGADALSQAVPNPFVGNPAFAATALGSNPTTTRAQLLRPYPQFVDVNMRQVSEGVNRYDAAVVEIDRRMAHGFAARVSYTYSRLMDNQIGETNFYTSSGVTAPMNNYNYDSSLPACAGGMSRLDEYNAKCFDPLVDYTHGILDVPHRLIVAPIVNLPFGREHRLGKSEIGNLLAGGWLASAVVTVQSGFPIGVSQGTSDSNLLGNSQRPNVVPGVSPSTPGSFADRLASADHPEAQWLNDAAFALAPANTWGDAPRLETDVRTPRIVNTDVSVARNIVLGGRKTAQVKLEIVNLFNRVQLSGFASTGKGSSAFGRIATQGGFMRMTQVMFRYSW